MAAPLFYSGDIHAPRSFTAETYSPREVIAVDQDPLGRQAQNRPEDRRRVRAGEADGDGSIAVGLFNLSEAPRRIIVTAADLG